MLNLTVAVGTISGLIFYANIVAANHAILLPFQRANVLTVFIPWLNLDLGIETCFYNGMDAYVSTWLQHSNLGITHAVIEGRPNNRKKLSLHVQNEFNVNLSK